MADEEEEENGFGEERESEDELNLREEEETHECAILQKTGDGGGGEVEAYPINGGDCEWKRRLWRAERSLPSFSV